MDKFQHKLRLIIVTGSTIGFMGGWALLAHAGKPASNSDVVVEDTSTFSSAPVAVQIATPAPLPPLDFKAIEAGQGTTVQSMPIVPIIQQQNVPISRPRFRTRTS